MAHLNNYLICYDIREPKRLKQVHKCACTYAMAIQRSVFYARLRAPELDDLIRELESLIDNRVDDIRIYNVAPIQQAVILGTNRTGVVGESWMIYFGEKLGKGE